MLTAEKTTPTTLLAELRGVIDQREELAKQDRTLAQRKEQIERALLAYHNDTGLDSLSGAGLSVSFDGDAMRAAYDPEKWKDIVRWAVESGNDFIVQRRLTDAKVIDLVKNGVELPPGLTLENYTKLSVRRK